jgi:hypothetical protein
MDEVTLSRAHSLAALLPEMDAAQVYRAESVDL